MSWPTNWFSDVRGRNMFIVQPEKREFLYFNQDLTNTSFKTADIFDIGPTGWSNSTHC